MILVNLLGRLCYPGGELKSFLDNGMNTAKNACCSSQRGLFLEVKEVNHIYTLRRNIIWENIKGPKSVLVFSIATALGAGLLPLAPGTMGSAVAIPLVYWSCDWPLAFRILFWLFLSASGVWAAKNFDQLMLTNDNQNIVIDEVIGMGITAWTAGKNVQSLVVAFIFFRFFDMVKLPPVRQLDKWSKEHSSPWCSGFGVIVDDILAGFQALAVILLLQWLNLLP